MAIFISIVSHNNNIEIINDLQAHRLKGPHLQPVILDNIPTEELSDYCQEHEIPYLTNQQPKGFGANHNQVFLYCQTHLGMRATDHFIVLNPDIVCDTPELVRLTELMLQHKSEIAAPDLYRDREHQSRENSVRRFPYIWDTFISFIYKGSYITIDREGITQPLTVDWASGACLAIQARLYQSLQGFDERYYLYYEDVDLCWRARIHQDQKLLYIPQVKITHMSQRTSHKIFTRHLLWHINSAIRFSLVRARTLLTKKTSRQ